MKYLILFLALALTGPIVITTPTQADSLNPATNNAQARSQPPLTSAAPNSNVSINNRVENGAPVRLKVSKPPVLGAKPSPDISEPSKLTDPAMKRPNNIAPSLPPVTVTVPRVKRSPTPN